MIEFKDHYAGRTNILRGPHAARGPYVVQACTRELFKPSKDEASLLGCNEENWRYLDFGFFGG